MGYPSDLLSIADHRSNDRHVREPQAPGDEAPKPRRGFRWVPIRSLSERHRPRIQAHLLALSEADRYLRFGFPATDAQIGQYVDRIDFDRDEVFGIFNRRLDLIATAHLAYLEPSHDRPAMGEYGVSVRASARGRGYGKRLFEHACLHARNRGVDTMIIHALTENKAMLHIVKEAGAKVEREGSESEARLKLPPDDFASRVEALARDQAAEIDYRLKANALLVDHVLEAVTEAREAVAKLRREGGD